MTIHKGGKRMEEYFLTEAPVGEVLQVVNILGGEEFRKIVEKLGIFIGSRIIKIDSQLSHVHIRVEGKEVFLTYEMAQRIIVRRFLQRRRPTPWFWRPEIWRPWVTHPLW